MPSLKRTLPASPTTGWTFLTNHAHVLLCIARDSEARIRDIATQVGITERAVQRILSELEEAGYAAHDRDGRRNRYEVREQMPLRHPLERHQNVASLIALVREAPVEEAGRAGARGAAKEASGGRAPRPRAKPTAKAGPTPRRSAGRP